MSKICAIDFETWDDGRDSACQIGLAIAEEGQITQRRSAFIRPPRESGLPDNASKWEYLHKIPWADVKDAPPFAEVWPTLLPLLEGVHLLVAHNVSFDRVVLESCCMAAKIPFPQIPWHCTQLQSERKWGRAKGRNQLNRVCERLGITLENHHRADHDAEACLRVYLALNPVHDQPKPTWTAPGVVAVGAPVEVTLPDDTKIPLEHPHASDCEVWLPSRVSNTIKPHNPTLPNFTPPNPDDKAIWWFARDNHLAPAPDGSGNIRAGKCYKAYRGLPLPTEADYWCHEGDDRWVAVEVSHAGAT